MQTNTVQTLIEYAKDLTGLTNASDAKVIRALNFAVDHYSYLASTSGGRYQWDSTNQTDINRVTATLTTSGKVEIENEVLAVENIDILIDGKYKPLTPVDRKDHSDQTLTQVYGESAQPTHYDLTSRHSYFYPTPDTSYTVRLTYKRTHPRYSTDNLTQSTGVMPIHEEYIALYAADRLMIGSNDPSRTAIRNELALKETEVRDMFSKRDQDTPRRLKAKVKVTK